MVFPPTSVRHFGASRVRGSRRDPVPAASRSAVLMLATSISSEDLFILILSKSILKLFYYNIPSI